MKHNTHQSNKTFAEKQHDIYEAVTRQILRNMTTGVIPWRQTWTVKKGDKGGCINYVTGKAYSFINALLIGGPGQYATYDQWGSVGGQVRKGSKGRMVLKQGWFIPKENKQKAKELEDEGKDSSHLRVWFFKTYSVFSIDDVDGLKPREEEQKPAMQRAEDPTDVAELVIDDYTINESVTVDKSDALSPRYDALTDTVSVPTKEAFTFEEDFYASLFEQLVHSTAAEGRCSRPAELKKMTEGEVSVKEELIAEIGSSMILTAAGMKRKETHEQISAVCQKWVREMNNDFRLIVDASRGAEKAAKLILGNFAE